MPALDWLGIALLVLWAVLWIGFKIVAIGVHLIVIAGLLLVLYALFRKGSAEVKRRM